MKVQLPLLLVTATAIVHGFVMPNTGLPDNPNGDTWAVLVAGSQGYFNYRHQADVCHAYQVGQIF